jgi:pimeloyl-ACP methyl ester carboxylesterase
MALAPIPRYSAMGLSLISFEKLRSGVTTKVVPLKAEDRGESKGVLYSKGGEKTVVCLMHPRADMSRHYAIPYLLDAGYAAFGQEGRWPNNDIACLHEMLLPDIAASIKYLKEDCGFDKVVFVGNSGGGSLYTFYQAQAVTEPPHRLTHTPAGDAYDLNQFELPLADGMIIIAAHLGEGKFMQWAIDPSVTNEDDPLSCDPELDMYNPENGFCEPPEPSTYHAAFIQRYRAAQTARVARIDAIARGYIEEQHYFRLLTVQDNFDGLPFAQRTFISRRALVGRYMEIHRTEANLAYTDPSINPSSRDYGSLWSPRPDLFNYVEAGFAKYQTPRAWLSNWSGLSAFAAVLDNILKVTIPTLIVNHTGDHVIYPADAAEVFRCSPAADKQLHEVDADHFGYHLPSKPEAGGRDASLKIITEWLRERFPAA